LLSLVKDCTPVTPVDELSPNNFNDFERENERKNEGSTLPEGVTTATTVTEPETKPKTIAKATCSKCGLTGDAFHMRIHIANCKGTR